MSHGLLLSILIPTLEQRSECHAFIRGKLEQQVADAGLGDEIEILSMADRGELPTGVKRNVLIERARGRFVSFVDDDDDVHEQYVSLVAELIRANPDIDCIGIKGEVSYLGGGSRLFVYSTRHSKYRTHKGIQERPPHQLNPIRREIAREFRYEPVWRSEDSDWAMQLVRARALRNEAFLDEVIYFYNSRRRGWVQTALDRTEFIRHPLGLQWVNRLRLKRWLREKFRL